MKLVRSFHQAYFDAVLKHLEKLLICSPLSRSVECGQSTNGFSFTYRSEEEQCHRYVTIGVARTGGVVLEMTTGGEKDKALPVLLKVVNRDHDSKDLAMDIFTWLVKEHGFLMHVPENGAIPGFKVWRAKGKTQFNTTEE